LTSTDFILHYLLWYLYGKTEAGLYVSSDVPIKGEAVWRTGFRRDEAISAACERAVEILLSAIESLSVALQSWCARKKGTRWKMYHAILLRRSGAGICTRANL
jgi:hypothetical protein